MACARRWSRGRNRLRLGGAELDAFFGFFVETHQALRAAVAVDVFLGQNCAQPALEGSPSGVGGEFGDTLAVASIGAIKIGVKGVGQFAGGGIFARDAQRRKI